MRRSRRDSTPCLLASRHHSKTRESEFIQCFPRIGSCGGTRDSCRSPVAGAFLSELHSGQADDQCMGLGCRVMSRRRRPTRSAGRADGPPRLSLVSFFFYLSPFAWHGADSIAFQDRKLVLVVGCDTSSRPLTGTRR